MHDELPVDPADPKDVLRRPLRGGSWYHAPGAAAASFRIPGGPSIRFSSFGLRLARVSVPPEK
jgi:formylglycine-generating enzyme required for sulfatase activity